MSDSQWLHWEIRFSNTRQRLYFFNEKTKESRWDPPEGMSETDITKLKGYTMHAKGQQPQASDGNAALKQIQASHLLIKHSESRRPSSWKETNITRSKDEAISILKSYQSQLQDLPPDELKEKFGELANTESDCSSHSSKGDLGPFGRAQMQKPFEDAAFALEVGEMSDIVSTDSGVHLILRTA